MSGRGADPERLKTFLKQDALKPCQKQTTAALTVLEPFLSMVSGGIKIQLVRKDNDPSETIRRNLHLFGWDSARTSDMKVETLDPTKPSPTDFSHLAQKRRCIGNARASLLLEGSNAMNECVLLALKRLFQEKMRKHYPRMSWQFTIELEDRLVAPFYELMDAVICGDEDLTPHIGCIQLFLTGIYPVPSKREGILYLPVAQP